MIASSQITESEYAITMFQQEENQKMRTYSFSDDTGDAQISVYSIAPGIEAAFVTAHIGNLDFGLFEKAIQSHYVGIHYCKEGRIEQAIHSEFLYLMPGDCSITAEDRSSKEFTFPLRHYHGVSIGIDTRKMDAALLAFLSSEGLEPYTIIQNICTAACPCVVRCQPALQDWFEDLYLAPEAERAAYLRVKLPELFFLLKHIDLSASQPEGRMLPRGQVETAKQVADYISRHIGEKITLKELTAHFGVSDTYLQTMFRTVYGMPVISFIRAQKMQSAAQELIHSLRSISDIATEYGYENEGKFSVAFKKIMGDSPSVYRKEHSKVKIL